MEENNHVVLISDGIETCEGDPCKVAADLVAKGLNVRVHVVGFDVDADAREQLQCIAEAGNGMYFDAQSAQALQQAVIEVRAVAQAEPEPEPATMTEVFRDDLVRVFVDADDVQGVDRLDVATDPRTAEHEGRRFAYDVADHRS